MRLLAIIIICFNFIAQPISAIELLSPPTAEELMHCPNITDKKTLTNGWYSWEPYQFEITSNNISKLTGMDVLLINLISNKLGLKTIYEPVPWRQHQLDLINGKRDYAAGATYSEERAKNMHFSIPYRFEENSLFINKDLTKSLNFDNIKDLLSQIRLQNFRLGIIDGYIYANESINEFINSDFNNDIIYKFSNDAESLNAVLNGQIDGFLADRVVGAATIFKFNAGDKIQELFLNIKTPIHLMFSKKTVSTNLVDKFNSAIEELKNSAEYNKIVKDFLYPVLLMQTIDAKWFIIVNIVGTIAFAIAGISIAAQKKSTIFTTLILAMLPSVGGGIIRDILLNVEKIDIILNPIYLYYILTLVLVSFILIRGLNIINEDQVSKKYIDKFWYHTFIISDAIGQAAFLVIGVAIAVTGKIDPILLWGPFFAFLTANSGRIIRDILIPHDEVCYDKELNLEISVLWGFIFALYLDLNAHDPKADQIQTVVIIVIFGAAVTRLLAHYYKLSNFRVNSYSNKPLQH